MPRIRGTVTDVNPDGNNTNLASLELFSDLTEEEILNILKFFTEEITTLTPESTESTESIEPIEDLEEFIASRWTYLGDVTSTDSRYTGKFVAFSREPVKSKRSPLGSDTAKEHIIFRGFSFYFVKDHF